MRILHLDPDDVDNPLSGGGPVRTYEIYRRLAARHQITVLTPTFPGSTPEREREGIRYVRLGRRIGDHGSSHHITFFLSLPGAIGRFEHDILVEDFMPPMSATFNPLFARKPMVASVQWFFAETLSRQYRLPFFLGERYGVRLYRNFVVLTGAMKRRIEALHPAASCEVIPNGAEDSLFDTPIGHGSFILFLGRVDFDQKGVDLLLLAYARIPAEERMPLVVAGHGYEWPRFWSLVDDLGIRSWIDVRGRVDLAERSRLLAECRFVCVPSRSETFGMVILEAQAAGKLVVVFDKAPMNEVATEGYERIEPFDVDAYSRGMRRLLKSDDAELLQEGRRCRTWAERFRWDAVALRQEAFYLRILDEARR